MSPIVLRCPNCARDGLDIFYTVTGVPVHNVRLLHSREAALAMAKGDIRIGICGRCGFISNTAFDPTLMTYSEDCEESQGSSRVFRRFHAELAEKLVHRHRLVGRHMVEIGCGKGEFLDLVCRAGCERAIGYDPAYLSGRIGTDVAERITVHPRYFTASDVLADADLVCCKMTLEHIPEPREFVRMIRTSLGERCGVPVFFMVPDMQRILAEGAFWDVYYEHCSYFTAGSLDALFGGNGFRVLEIERLYDGQYLGLHAVTDGPAQVPAALPEAPGHVVADAQRFSREVTRQRRAWQGYLHRVRAAGKRVALWGGGSKAVAFVTTMGIGDEIACIVDIQPRKQGCFLPGSGHPVVAPERLQAEPADVVIVMNPVYRDEVAATCTELGTHPVLLTVEQGPPV